MTALTPQILPRWLKMRDATKYAALNEHRIKRLAVDGLIVGFKDPDTPRGDWIFDRLSLDEYREGQAGDNEHRYRLAKIKASMSR